MQIKSCSGLLAILAGAILVAEYDSDSILGAVWAGSRMTALARIRLFRASALEPTSENAEKELPHDALFLPGLNYIPS